MSALGTDPVMGKKQQQKYNKLVNRRGQAAADAYQSKLAGRGALASDPVMSAGGDVFGKKQQNKYDRILQNKGQEAADAYKQKIADRKGVSISPADSDVSGVSDDMTGTRPEPPGYRNPTVSFDEASDRINSAVGSQFDSVMGRDPFAPQNLPEINLDFSAERQRIEDQVYNQQTKRLDERFGREREQMAQQLANQGIPMGSEAYNNAMKDFDMRRNDAYESARGQAMQMGGQEADRLYSQATGARGQLYNEQLQNYRQPLETLGAINPYFNTGAQGEFLGREQEFTRDERLGSQDFQAQQAAKGFDYQKELDKLNNQARLQQVRSSGGGGTDQMALENQRFQNQMKLQDRNFFNQQALAAAQGGGGAPLPSVGAGFGSGFAAGAGSAAIR